MDANGASFYVLRFTFHGFLMARLIPDWEIRITNSRLNASHQSE